MTRIAVSGCGGFVGRRVVAALEVGNIQVVPLPTMSLRNAASAPYVQDAPFRELSEHLAGCDAVVHVGGLAHRSGAASDAFDVANHQISKILAEATVSANVSRMVYVSSIAVHGRRLSSPVTSKSPLRPDTPYGLSKARAEDALCDISRRTQLQVICLRPPLVCGANAPGNLDRLRSAIVRGIPLPCPSWNKRDLVGVRNLADMIVRAAQCPQRGDFHAMPVSDGEPVSTLDIAQCLAKGAGRSARTFPLSRSALNLMTHVPFLGSRLEQLCSDLRVDGRDALQHLGITLRHATRTELEVTGRGLD